MSAGDLETRRETERVVRAASVGAPMDRVDGRLKVTGGARYSAEMPVENVAYGYIVQSTIEIGRAHV